MHRRRQFLAAVGTAGTAALPGCSTSNDANRGVEPTSFEFAGAVLQSRPTAEKYQPLDVTVAIERIGAQADAPADSSGDGPLYEETHTVDDLTDGTVAVVREPWMPTRTPHAITVSSPAHEARTVSTATLDEQTETFTDRQVAVVFDLRGLGIYYSPIDVEDEWGGA